MKIILLLFVVSVVIPSYADRIHKIVVKGNRIIETGAILAKISSRPARAYQLNQVRKDVKKLFETGWFSHIEVDFKKTKSKKIILTYAVKENPIVEKVSYKGNKNISKKEMDKLFLVSQYEFLDHKKIKQAIENLKEEYSKKGYYLADISYRVEAKNPKDKGKVDLLLQIRENNKTIVKRIEFQGNRSIKSSEIKAFMLTKEQSLFGLFSSSQGVYNRKVLEHDRERIKFLYMDRGYFQVQVGEPKVFISQDKKNVSIHVPIQEGDVFEVSQISFAGDTDVLLDGQEVVGALTDHLQSEEGKVLSYGKLGRDMEYIQKRYGDEGYAFCNVIPRMAVAGKGLVHLRFEIQKGKKVKIRRIDITGNSHTRDKVIRREVRVYENEFYHEGDKERSRQNIQRLGFFDEVKVGTKTIPQRDGVVDMEIEVKEREMTGMFTAGVQVGGPYGISGHLKVQRMNLFGRGQNISVMGDLNFNRQYVNLSFTEPYLLDSPWFFGTDFQVDYWNYDRISGLAHCQEYEEALKKLDNQMEAGKLLRECQRVFPDLRFRSFSEQKTDAGFILGRSFSDTWSGKVSSRWGYIKIYDDLDKDLSQKSSGFRNPLKLTLEYDGRDDRMFPKSGFYILSSLRYNSPLFSKFNYITWTANMRFYQELFWGMVFRLNTRYGHHTGLGKQSFVPMDEKFRLGGIDSLRGFDYFSIGPRKRSQLLLEKATQYGYENPEALAWRVEGGLKEALINVELQIPLLGKNQFMGVLFFDTGSAYDRWSSLDLRSNWGLGLRVLTPMGPIRLEWGFPLNPRAKDMEPPSRMNFTLGFPF